MIRKIFIANRGEIAARIARTANSMGISTVCCTALKKPPQFLQQWISEFVYVDKEDPSLYLNHDRMISIAKQTACDAVHPGFGFLSENSIFAKKVIENHLTWIGPKPKVIEQMANKADARELAKSLNIPCTEGFEGINDLDHKTLNEVHSFANRVGLPLLVKAAMGGGGKGMRLVNDLSQLKDALERASSESLNSFGDKSLILEQYIESSRHIEVQVLGDEYGNIAILGDRDCTLQRRHQKIIEEAPALNLHPETRKKLHECARNLAQAVNYSSAGTVEFLLDSSKSNKKPQKIYFLEMNTRLQVEHPVTEEIFETDLVEAQIRIAQREKLGSLSFKNFKDTCHSIEARIYGEDPDENFFPSPGVVHYFQPFHQKGVRWEIGLDSFDEITSNFDPMIAKVIATGKTRKEAQNLLSTALKNTVFFGPKNNKEFLINLLESSWFTNHEYNTHTIEKLKDQLLQSLSQQRQSMENVVNCIFEYLILNFESHSRKQEINSKGVSLNQITQINFSKDYTKNPLEGLIEVDFIQNSKHLAKNYSEQIFLGKGTFSRELGSNSTPFIFSHSLLSDQSQIWYLHVSGMTFIRKVKNSNEQDFWSQQEETGGIIAPVPGKVIKVLNTGAKVTEGLAICVIESMKMEFEVKSPQGGILEKVIVKEGEQVEAGQILAYFDL